MSRRDCRSMTTVFCMRVDTTTPSSACPRTDRRPGIGHFAPVHDFSGTETSPPSSLEAEPIGFAGAAVVAGFFCAFFSAIRFTGPSSRDLRVESESRLHRLRNHRGHRNGSGCRASGFAFPLLARRLRACCGSHRRRVRGHAPDSGQSRRRPPRAARLTRASGGSPLRLLPRWSGLRGSGFPRGRGPSREFFLAHDREDAGDVLSERPDLPRVRRCAAHRGHASLVHQLVPKLRELLPDRLRVHRADLLRPEQWHYVSSPPPVSTSASTPSSLTCLATFFSRFVATLLFLTFLAGSGSSGTMRGSGSSTDSSSPGPATAATSTIGSGARTGSSAAAAAAARYSAVGLLISTSSGSFACGSMISTVTPMIPGFNFADANPRSIHRFRGSPQYLMWPALNFSARCRWPVSFPALTTRRPFAPASMIRRTVE